jgi:purine nucleosidase
VTELVVDTDIGSDVDDALALALAVRHPDLELRAVTTVSSQPAVRATMARRLLAVAGAPEVEVVAGRAAPGDDRNVIGAEHLELLGSSSVGGDRDGAIGLLTSVSDGTAIATIGQQTNLAAALDRDPLLARRASSLTVMGGSFAPFTTPDGQIHGAERDWNLVLDPQGAAASLAAPWALRYVPIDVTFRVVLTRDDVQLLRAGDALCRLLADLVDGWRARTVGSRFRTVAALLHDPLAIACVADCPFVTVERLPVVVDVGADGLARTLIDPDRGRDADVVRAVDARAFVDWFVDVLVG